MTNQLDDNEIGLLYNLVLKYLSEGQEINVSSKQKANLKEILSTAKLIKKSFKKGEYLISLIRCVDTKEVCLVTDGIVINYFNNDNGEQKVCDVIVPGNFALYEGLYGRKQREFEWYALTDVTIISFSLDEFREILTINEQFKRLYIGILEHCFATDYFEYKRIMSVNAIDQYRLFCLKYKGYANEIDNNTIASFLRISAKRLREVIPYSIVEYALIEGMDKTSEIWPDKVSKIEDWYMNGMDKLESLASMDISETDKLSQKLKELYKEAIKVANLLNDKDVLDLDLSGKNKKNSVVINKEKVLKAISIIKKYGKIKL